MSEDNNQITTKEVENDSQESLLDTSELEVMAEAGLLFGRKRKYTNPKMKQYIYTTRNGFELFDLEITQDMIAKAVEYVREVAKTGQSILFVGTRPEAQEPVKALAEKFKFPYVIERWLGGTLTNFNTISERLGYYITLKADQESGKLQKYTKKEQTAMDKKIGRLNRLFSGLEELKAKPGLLIVVGADSHEIAILEAKASKIPVLAIANTSASPDLVNVLIPANDRSKSSIQFILNELEKGIEKGIKEKDQKPVEKKEEEKK